MNSLLRTTFFLSVLATMPARADLVQTAEGQNADPSLKIKQSGVPQFDIYQTKKVKGKNETYRLKNIPRLNVGVERQVKSQSPEPLDLPKSKSVKLANFKLRPSPKDIQIDDLLKKLQIPALAEAKVVMPADAAPVPVFTAPIAVTDPLVMKPEPKTTEIKDLKPNELKLLQALIFLEVQKNYPMALGLFAELLDEAPEIRTEAIYNLALTGKGLGLYSEYRYQMLKVLDDKNLEWQKKAAKSLAENADQGDIALVPILDPKLEALKIETEKPDQYQINRAKYYLSQDELKRAVASTDQVLMDSKLYPEAQFLKGILQYRSGQVQDGLQTLTSTLALQEQQDPKAEMKSIIALTLARLQFQLGDYKSAFQSYLKIDKKHPEWPQAMIEQAWAQVLSGDNEGAAGNMFSLHTEFFKNTFAPESYIVRAVGYLNLCQYGDGARVVQDMKQRYLPFKDEIDAYRKAHTSDLDYYETVKTFMTKRDPKEIDGLPRTFIWALARNPNYLLEQQNINSLEDQVSRYNKITMDLIKREKFLLAEQNKSRTELVALKKNMKPGEKNERSQELEKRLLSFQVQHFIVKKARNSIKDIRAQGLARVDKEKQEHKALAGHALANRMSAMSGTLTASLDQTDVLSYELYAGAGEHLRYQAAGGEIKPSENEGLKPEANKQLKWDFKGEVWEDELGHYRSALKNVCPENEESTTETPKVTASESKSK